MESAARTLFERRGWASWRVHIHLDGRCLHRIEGSRSVWAIERWRCWRSRDIFVRQSCREGGVRVSSPSLSTSSWVSDSVSSIADSDSQDPSPNVLADGGTGPDVVGILNTGASDSGWWGASRRESKEVRHAAGIAKAGGSTDGVRAYIGCEPVGVAEPDISVRSAWLDRSEEAVVSSGSLVMGSSCS